MTLSINIPDHHSDEKNFGQASKSAGRTKFNFPVCALGCLLLVASA